MAKEYVEKAEGKDTLVCLFFIAFGIYLLAGAYSAASSGEWPIFMPPQIDLFGLLFRIFGKPWGGYVGALFLALLGGGSAWLGVFALWRGRHA